MKKIYSLVLMAVALLIGTNAWAGQTRTANDAASFETAWTAAQDGDVIQLTNDVTIDQVLWLGTTAMSGTGKSIELNLNGKVLESSAPKYMFFITHGALNITGNGIIKHTGDDGTKDHNQETFRLTGSSDQMDAKTMEMPFTHLTIGAGVTVQAKVQNAIVIDQKAGTEVPSAAWKTAGVTTLPTYTTSGLATGVRVDVYGRVEGEKYAFKVNGTVKRPSAQQFSDSTTNSPYVYLHGSSDLSVPASSTKDKKPVAVYCSGYARWLIEGHCVGSTAVYVKAGEVDINDAIIESNYNGEYVAASATNSGVTASGSAIVIESNKAYQGSIDVEISGDTKVSATHGYAIDESVTNANNTKVETITISGGTFEGGVVPNPEHKTDPTAPETIIGIMTVSEMTATAAANPDTITTINIIGASTNQGEVTIGNQDLADYLNTQSQQEGGTKTHVTAVVDENGKTTMVISQGEAPAEDPVNPTTAWDYIESNTSSADPKSYNWTAIEADEIAANTTVTLDELQINAGTDASHLQQLTINEGASLVVNRLLMNAYARIIVEPGAKLIVKGAQGIIAPVAENIVLKASDVAQAIFFFNPAVTSNREPNATVQLYTNCKQLSSSPWTYVYQRFSIPMKKGIAAPTNDFSGELFPGNASFKTYAWQWNGTSWDNLSSWATVEPFKGYQLANNSNDGGVTYAFTGKLVGNGDAEYDFPTGGFDFCGSSHTAPIYIDSLLKPYEGTNMEATAWVYNYNSHQWQAVTSSAIADFPTLYPSEIRPMDGFVLRIRNVASGTASMSYASAIWGNPNWDALLGRPSQKNPAPARNRANTTNRAMISVVAENGFGDNVALVEKDQYSTEFDNGADASKFMSADGISLYATTEVGELANVATDDLKGTLLSFRSGNGTQYTISMTNVLGEDYALRDNVTGQVIALAEGATYTFMQEANTTVPARFEVIGVAEIPTAIDNVEETAKVNGIYTMTGQYVGRDFTKLPAGVYVVNGVKIVK